jgi:hypothetical protein
MKRKLELFDIEVQEAKMKPSVYRAFYKENKRSLIIDEKGEIEIEIVREDGKYYLIVPEEAYHTIRMSSYDVDFAQILVGYDGRREIII